MRNFWKMYTSNLWHGNIPVLCLGHEKRNPVLQPRPTQIFFSAENLVKSAVFWPRSENFEWNFLKISLNIFPKIFLQKISKFSQNFRVFEVIFWNHKWKKIARPTDPTWQVHPPIKQGFFFCGLSTTLGYLYLLALISNNSVILVCITEYLKQR